MHLQEKTIGSETTYLGKVFYVTKDTARLEDGKAVQRDVVHHSGGVCVVPLTEKAPFSWSNSSAIPCSR